MRSSWIRLGPTCWRWLSARQVTATTIAAAVGEDVGTLEEVYEPFLVQNGFLQRTPRGRMATAQAYKHFGFNPPTGSGQPTLF